MASDKITPVILSGGAGTRLWPLSRTFFPKQFLPLASSDSLLVDTVRRSSDAALFGKPIIVCNEQHRFMVAEQLRQAELPASAIVLEPVGRNTAPAIAIAALILAAETPEALMLVAPSDHVVRDLAAFQKAVGIAASAATQGALVTFGIAPTGPETGYGYIKYGQKTVAPGIFAVEKFVEKPNRATAESYLKAGGYAWNSGMFLFRADALIAEFEKLQPTLLEACRATLAKAKSDLDFLRLDPESFKAVPSDSIDYAIMERTDKAAIVPVDLGWSDVGSWNALWEIAEHDQNGNVLMGDTVVEDVTNSYIRTEGRLTAVVGISDLMLIVTDDAVLAASRDRVQDVKKIVDKLKIAKRDEADLHSVVYRPWGSYQGIDAGERFQVKRIVVNPGSKLSLQMHHHRAEHWIVVQGTARVVRGEDTTMLYENESIYIPMGAKHRLENPGKVPLHLIEVQSGSYLGEDDIVRFQDDYGRG
jgi:mannose-1-phosphate guanylyltransferase/mannose-6-phosphate isomerase